ncbi:tetratricopeptide repeat protein 12 [Scaptodrosophila lebanonensis]|uniref:Tetratricopeptide repeat protein 12 n=1 Tax=Drosophila lebanonensis TaxID=7225 RepID=A0A6J2TBX7_DROLE|nr:tetratricopeptide repeat protein 12 [Scaptodrosophila lebanonensis]
MQHPQIDESFLHNGSKLDDVMKLLHSIASAQKPAEEELKLQTGTITDITEDNFVVAKRREQPELNKQTIKSNVPESNKDLFTFMRQMEINQEERSKARLERERVAQNFRKLGNFEYRRGSYEVAMRMYSEAIENIKDSPVLYINRALCYIKLERFKRAIIDCDFVLNTLDEKNLRAWLYRAAAYKSMNDDFNYDNCVKFARKYNSKQMEFIDKFLQKMQTDL